MAEQFPSFDEAKIQEVLEGAKQFHADNLQAKSAQITFDDGHLSTRAACITLTIANGRVCVNLPLGIGSVCVPVPVSYNGQVASACIDICTTWGIPTGVKLTVSVAGVVIVQKTFGKC